MFFESCSTFFLLVTLSSVCYIIFEHFHTNCHITYAIKVILALWSFYHSVHFRIDVLIIKENMMRAMTIRTLQNHCNHHISNSHIRISDRFSL